MAVKLAQIFVIWQNDQKCVWLTSNTSRSIFHRQKSLKLSRKMSILLDCSQPSRSQPVTNSLICVLLDAVFNQSDDCSCLISLWEIVCSPLLLPTGSNQRSVLNAIKFYLIDVKTHKLQTFINLYRSYFRYFFVLDDCSNTANLANIMQYKKVVSEIAI